MRHSRAIAHRWRKGVRRCGREGPQGRTAQAAAACRARCNALRSAAKAPGAERPAMMERVTWLRVDVAAHAGAGKGRLRRSAPPRRRRHFLLSSCASLQRRATARGRRAARRGAAVRGSARTPPAELLCAAATAHTLQLRASSGRCRREPRCRTSCHARSRRPRRQALLQTTLSWRVRAAANNHASAADAPAAAPSRAALPRASQGAPNLEPHKLAPSHGLTSDGAPNMLARAAATLERASVAHSHAYRAPPQRPPRCASSMG